VYLYVSSANYGAVTRPAFSAALSFPLPWIEPPAVRAAMTRRAAHLGMSSLDTDSVSPGELGGKDMAQDPTLLAGHPVFHARNAPVSSALAPEQRSRIRLETLAGEVFKILSSADWQSDREQLPDVRCLAYAYLALMAAPGVPRPWLREILEGRYEPLHRFMLDFQKETFPEGTEALPWAEGEENTPGAVTARFARGVLFQVPGVGTLWRRWWASRKRKQLGIQTKSGRGGFLVLIGASLGLTVVGVGVWFYRTLHPFGASVQVWRKPLIPNGFGAAGLVLGALYGMT
jgi:sorting and assembly machinery component 37